MLAEITGEVNRRKTRTPMTGSTEPTGEQPEASQVAIMVLEESDFTPDTHQVIPSELCYGPLLIAKDSGGFE